MASKSLLTGLNVPHAATESGFAQSLLSVVFGTFMIGVVGFSHIDVVHNAAHDARHSFDFPCH